MTIKVALIHDWLIGNAGGEKVLADLHLLFPSAPIYTLVSDKERIPPSLNDCLIYTSFLQNMPGVLKNHSKYLPLMPMAIEQFDLKGYDLILSSSSCAAKGVLVAPDQLHLCYCHSPARYVWDLHHEYIEHTQLSTFARRVFKLTAHYFRMWDVITSNRTDYFIANSQTTANRIRKYYNRESIIINPPVDTEFFKPSLSPGAGHFLMVGRVVPYKRFDLATRAFAHYGAPLHIVGDGPSLLKLKHEASKNIEFYGSLSDNEILALYQSCRALIFPGLEDFGIVPVEAMACGKPVIAFGQGGAAETVVDGVTGVLFYEQSVDSLLTAIKRFKELDEAGTFDPDVIRAHALQFGRKRFREQIKSFIGQFLDQ